MAPSKPPSRSAQEPEGPEQLKATASRKSARQSNSKHTSSKRRWAAIAEITARVSVPEVPDQTDMPQQQQRGRKLLKSVGKRPARPAGVEQLTDT